MKKRSLFIIIIVWCSIWSCAKESRIKNNIEGAWGMTYSESLMKKDGEILSHEIIRCDPFEPTGDGDMKLVIKNTVGNEYQVDAYRWDKKKSSWVPDRHAIDSPWIIQGNMISDEHGSFPFTLTSETLTFEGSGEEEVDLLGFGNRVTVYRYDKAVFRKMSELFE